jgi:hypothetical protein
MYIMKILYVNTWMHPKNHNSLMNYKNINFHIIKDPNLMNSIDLTQFDCVYSPTTPINVNNFPKTKFIFGPHFSVFPEKTQIDMITGNNTIYSLPCDWSINYWKYNPVCKYINFKSLPFGVDTDKFNEIVSFDKRTSVFLYYKRRSPEELAFILNFLEKLNINVRIFNYISQYKEEDYINYLHNSKFGIWLDAHESQGFALQEALSCNVPLFVWSVTSMNQEYGSNYADIPATTIPYWDNRCGESFTTISEIEDKFQKFIDNLSSYKPREYIVENLSMDVCEKKLVHLIQNI